MKFIAQIKPLLPVIYIAGGIIVGAFGMKSCTADPEPEVVTRTRTVEIPGPSDTVEVRIEVPARPIVKREPLVILPDSQLTGYIEALWTENDRLQARIDSLENIKAVARTQTPEALLSAHLDMPAFLRNPREGLWAEAKYTVTDTTRTNVRTESGGIRDYVGFGLYGGAGYNMISKTVDFQVGGGVMLKLDRLFY